MNRSRLAAVFLFLYLWLLCGFMLGTLTLVGPARWASNAAKGAHWDQGRENILVLAVIIAFVAVSLLCAHLLNRYLRERAHGPLRVALPVLATLGAALTVGAWMRPELMGAVNGRSVDQVRTGGGAQFVFGGYPDQADLRRLKAEGYSGVISLLHPAVIPFEPKLIAEEKATAAAEGIRLVQAPMLPWVSDNRQSLEQILTLADTARGRYYVHCYLGKDRVNIVRRALQQRGASIAGDSVGPDSGPRQLRDYPFPFMGGEIVELVPHLWLVPQPTGEEFGSFFLGGQVRHVVLLLDPTDSTQALALATDTSLLSRFGVQYTLPSSTSPDSAAMAAARTALQQRSLGTTVVITAATPPVDTTARAQAFRSALQDALQDPAASDSDADSRPAGAGS